MDYQHLLVTAEDGIVTARLNRPAERNALNPRLMQELTYFAREHRLKHDVRAVILAGGAEFFSAGADLTASALAPGAARPSLLELRETVMAGPDMCRAWEEIEAPTIMAVEGYCVGGACALALCCDFRVVSTTAQMRLPEVPMGINMSWHSLPRLTTLVGPARAKQFTMFGEFANAATMAEWGMVDEVVQAGAADGAAMRWALRLAALPPLPIRMTKESINAVANANHHASTFMDRDQFLLTFATEDLKEGIAAFMQKRKPSFKGN